MVQIPDEIDLTAPQARVLGSLIEKAATTPDAYPLTLKALTTACNQTSSRDPVVDYDPQLVETTALALKAKGLARVVHPGSGERATKYRQVLDEAFELGPAEMAVIGVLLLRGAQTASELRTRTERLHRFADVPEVEATLHRLAEHSDRPLVAKVERQPGQKDARWIQLLEADPEGRAAASASSAGSSGGSGGGRGGRAEELERRVDALERRVAQLVEALGDLVDLPDAADPDGDAT